MSNKAILAILLIRFFFVSILCGAQAGNVERSSTFQGEIEGVSPLIVHLKVKGGIVEGFYKYPSDSVVVFLKGTLDDEGKLLLSGAKKPYPEFSGRLEGRLITGSYLSSKKAKPQPFYAFDFRGEYCNLHNLYYFRLFLSDKGYEIESLSQTYKKALISTCRHEDGRIYLRSDSLNARLYLHGDTLVVDTIGGLPSFMSPYERYGSEYFSFTPTREFWDSGSFVEFPEKDEEFKPEGSLIVQNDVISIRLSRIPRSEYVVGKWAAPRARTYQAITDFTQVKKKLGKKLKSLKKYDEESDEWRPAGVEITYNDGTKRVLDWFYDWEAYPGAFTAFYPELDIVIFESEAGGDEVIDLNDSSLEYKKVGNPFYHAVSPEGRWRITGYYPGGAADTEEWWLEMWNPSLKRYEYFSGDDPRGNGERWADSSVFRYIGGWFWIDNNTVLFKQETGFVSYYKLEIAMERNGK